MSDRFDWVSELAPYIPPGIGAVLSLRYTKDQTPAQKALSFVLGFGLGVYGGPALGELLSLGPKAPAGAGILIAVLGYDVIGGVLAALAQFKENPLVVGRRWINAWFGRSDA